MASFKTVTLGCKVNQYETEYVRQGLLRAGYQEAGPDQPADLCIVNTCTVTMESDYKSRKVIRALSRENPRTEIIVMGCYASRAPEEVASLPRVIHVLTDKSRLGDLVARLGRIDPPSGIASFGRLHRAYVKIQDGCPMACSYCIIPSVRPTVTSRPPHEVLEEVRCLVEHGHREVVLSGIHLGCYAADRAAMLPPGTGLTALLRRLVDLDGEFRVRLSSLEASEITLDLLALMAERSDRICPHLHIPLQSGSDTVLARMRRRQTASQFLACCEQVRQRLDQPALTTDVIVGFPGETDSDFEATCRVVREVGFCRVHVFRFSPRQGTLAARMDDQVAPHIKQQRAQTLNHLASSLRRQFCRALLGRRLQVVAETLIDDHPGLLSGTADRYVTVQFPGGPDLMDRIVDVKATGLLDWGIRASCVECAGLTGSSRSVGRPPATVV